LKKVLVLAVIIVAVGFAVFVYKTRNPQSVQKGIGASQSAQMPKSSPATRGTHSSAQMKMLPRKSASNGSAPIRYTMSKEAKILAQVQTTKVKREKALKRLRTVGMVYGAETRMAALTARIGGRLDKLFIDFTGVKVNKGDPMVTIWSPELYGSQIELFESIRSRNTEDMIRGAEEKLMQFGLTQEQIDEIRKSRKPDVYVTLRAPISGIVMKKMAVVGQYVKEGQDMFVINDLSHVWVKLDAYEPDLPWIRFGQTVTFTTPSIPGKTFKGQVNFIDPVLDMTTRTVNVRVDVPNPNYELKPHMFVNAEIESEVDDHGEVVKPEWIGKYICPSDPTEVSDKPGTCFKTVQCQRGPGASLSTNESDKRNPCRKAKQAMLPATAYGYSDIKIPILPLVIPESAVLFTGKRSIVYVEMPDQSDPTYEQRDVTLGPRVGNKYIVFNGLKVGDRVVVKGNFQIDSSVQILGEPSMMNPVKSKKPPSVGLPTSHTTPKSSSSDLTNGENTAQEKSPAPASDTHGASRKGGS
jgi:Cu(I)/Ag(I) efflux system membrane fusion protein